MPRPADSLRSGWPSHQGGMRIRGRSGRPSKPTPNMSQTSRSYQAAAGNTPVMVGSAGVSPSSATLRRTSLLCSSDIRW